MEDTKYNKAYNSNPVPKVTVITSVYNRREILLRAMESVANQTFKDLEYIVVNNGSTIDIDDIVEGFMEHTDMPVVYIKRDNGAGPHTGKNSAIRAARGEYIVMLDSDDELLPDCLSRLYNTWMSIPEDIRPQYREVVARCVDQNDNEIGARFPEELNTLSLEQAYNFWHKPGFGFECVSMDRTEHLKSMPFPEPAGVSWVVDSIVLWDRLSKRYKSFFINDCLKRYYTDSTDSITNTQINKVTRQHVTNMLFALKFKLDHYDEYFGNAKTRIKDNLMYNTFRYIISTGDSSSIPDWVCTPLKIKSNRFLSKMLYLPSIPVAMLYKAHKM